MYIFPRPILVGLEGSTSGELDRGKLGPIDLTSQNRAYYYFVLGVLVVVLLLVGHLRRTGIGRAIVGVRENEAGAAAFTVSPTRAKLTAFALGGFLAGLGGAVLAGTVQTFDYTNSFFRVQDSLSIVAMAVIGGLGSLAGAVTGALWVVGLPLFWPKNETVSLLTSSIGLLIVLLYIPGGFTQLGYALRGQILRWVEKRVPERPAKTVTAPPVSLSIRAEAAPPTNDDGSTLRTIGLSVDFGGLVAVDSVDFHAMPGEVIGLIGTNGAGKSTLLNAIGGYVPSRGQVELLGGDVSRLPPYLRARSGLGRTFQAATLFPELTVRETVQLALEARGRTSFWGSLLFYPGSIAKERTRRAEAAELIDFLGLGRYADRFIAELSTGTRRIVELTSMLAVRPRVICLDEPTAGVARARGRGVRPADQADPARARRDPRRRRARHAAHHVDQRPDLLSRGGRGDRARHAGHRSLRPARRRVLPGCRRPCDPAFERRREPRDRVGPRSTSAGKWAPHAHFPANCWQGSGGQAPETFCTAVTCVQSPSAPIEGS